jgi:hypothetical protein
LFQNQKVLEKNNKEIKKYHKLSSNKEIKEELLIKQQDKISPKELNSMKQPTNLLKKLKSVPEDKPS